jgi:hypothetical protein
MILNQIQTKGSTGFISDGAFEKGKRDRLLADLVNKRQPFTFDRADQLKVKKFMLDTTVVKKLYRLK